VKNYLSALFFAGHKLRPPCIGIEALYETCDNNDFQIVSALAIMMDMKKGVVNETVKENRADELSAMFNMMIDNRKRIMGE